MKYIASFFIAFGLMLGILAYQNKVSVGSVVDSGTYSFKNITSTNASATVPVTIRTGRGTLGSIVVNTTHATIIRVYEGVATSTGTLIASFPASAVVGTYTFDVAVSNGIVLDIPSWIRRKSLSNI